MDLDLDLNTEPGVLSLNCFRQQLKFNNVLYFSTLETLLNDTYRVSNFGPVGSGHAWVTVLDPLFDRF